MQAREGFNNLRSAKATSDEATKGITHAEEVAKLLRHNIVQAQKVEGKDALRKLQFAICRTCADQLPTELRIHDDIERGDNDSIKNPRGGTVKVDRSCS
jgi:complex III assembly factor LYRM7